MCGCHHHHFDLVSVRHFSFPLFSTNSHLPEDETPFQPFYILTCSVHVDRKYLRLASRLLQSIFFILHSEFRKVLNTVLCERFENDASGLRGFRCTNLELYWSRCSLCYKNHRIHSSYYEVFSGFILIA